jgi:3'-phosphoadenosine 5'-phosphosulfate sulfotransferase (PAPS reductase)/FAD synthetase
VGLPLSSVRPLGGRDLDVAVDDLIIDAIACGAWFAFNLSGGKDSTASAQTVIALLDHMGHPRARRIAIHADLGRAEWRSTPATVAVIARRLGLPLVVVRRGAGDMVARWEQRFANGCRRYENLELYHLIGPWSQANKRFCTSELKAQVIGPALARRFRGEKVVSVIGLRRAESHGRRDTPISRLDVRFAKPGNAAGTRMINWYPGVDWTADDVFAVHAHHDLPLHEAYCRFGATRLSCAFCVLASAHDLAAASDADDNRDLYRHLVGMEAASTFSFQPGRWLADVAPRLLTPSLHRDIVQAKADAVERRAIEAAMPPGLRFVKGKPPRLPTLDEAKAVAAARAGILSRHGLDNHFPDAASVRRRFEELIDAHAA